MVDRGGVAIVTVQAPPGVSPVQLIGSWTIADRAAGTAFGANAVGFASFPLPDPQVLDVSCTVNGEVRQSGSTAEMFFGVAELVSHISRSVTLAPGDLIFTGTPEGVGPLLRGDAVVGEVDGVGSLAGEEGEDRGRRCDGANAAAL